MRRLFWCGTALIAAMTAAAYAAAEYARHNPDSSLARGAWCAYRVCVEDNPIAHAAQVIAGRVPAAALARASRACNGATCAAAQGQPAQANASQPVQVELFGPEDFTNLFRCQSPAAQANDTGGPCPRTLVCTPDETSATPPWQEFGSPERIHGGVPAVTVPAGAVEESEDNPGAMPLSADDDSAAPSVMPYVEDGDDSAPFFNFWIDLLGEAAARSHKDQQPDTSAAAGSEESEEASESGPADCREDPAYPYQYPGCPSTATCPAGGCHKPKTRPQLTPKVMGDLEEQSAPPDLLLPPHKPVDAEPDADSPEESPIHPDVDTMEFRPSDAREGEFEPHPM